MSLIPFDRLDMPSVGVLDVWRAVDALFDDGTVRLAGNAYLKFFDTSYGLPSDAQLHEAIAALTTSQMHYELGLMTCYDFTHMARGELAAMGLGKVTIGEVVLAVSGANGELLGYHDCLIAGTNDGGRYFIEPQTERFYSLDNPVAWIFPTATHATITDLIF